MTKIIASTPLYSGFRLHPGAPYPTSRSLEARPGARAASSSVDSAAEPVRPVDLTPVAVEQAIGHARVEEWAARVSAGGPTSLLVARPALDGATPQYPSAVEAYREIAKLIEEL
ncbi:hypothetical protein SAZ10_32970 [Mesorhizobium sp. BAC0120]|uniref:hypothetical protein n=1 Tax=Mesorhizobium sp. BAC0120 TaxID=3090670 RepID=UPI00298CE76B|nr:hypothetical protein [Mesorhizobium sp. BAC0120]MDW6026584.1 hypothetical protein [Mesorhizobium sp. BAC0120]